MGLQVHSTDMVLILSMVLAANSWASTIRGFDKPAKEERGILGESELTKGKVKIYCADVGRFMLVEINDPGLKGARDIWLRKKMGDVMPACNDSDTGVIRLDGAAQYGYLAGIKGGFAFVMSADGSSGFMGVRVYSLLDGVLVYDHDFDSTVPAVLTTAGKTTVMRFHIEIHTRCQPTGAEASSCWKEIRAGAVIPESVKITPPPCDALLKTNPDMLGALVAVPVEIDLSSPKKPKFIDGAATCTVPG